MPKANGVPEVLTSSKKRIMADDVEFVQLMREPNLNFHLRFKMLPANYYFLMKSDVRFVICDSRT